MQKVDTLINARWVIPVEPDTSLAHHSIVLHQGKVLAILPTADARQQYQADDTIDLDQHAVIPGLVNAHTHAAMALFRGLADDLPAHEEAEDPLGDVPREHHAGDVHRARRDRVRPRPDVQGVPADREDIAVGLLRLPLWLS